MIENDSLNFFKIASFFLVVKGTNKIQLKERLKIHYRAAKQPDNSLICSKAVARVVY